MPKKVAQDFVVRLKRMEPCMEWLWGIIAVLVIVYTIVRLVLVYTGLGRMQDESSDSDSGF